MILFSGGFGLWWPFLRLNGLQKSLKSFLVIEMNWNSNFSDNHDYLHVIDNGYLTIKQFLDYNKYRDMFPELSDNEWWSMANSND